MCPLLVRRRCHYLRILSCYCSAPPSPSVGGNASVQGELASSSGPPSLPLPPLPCRSPLPVVLVPLGHSAPIWWSGRALNCVLFFHRGSHRRFCIYSGRCLRRSWLVVVVVGNPRRDADAGTPAATPTGCHCTRQGSCSRLSRRRSSLTAPPAIAATGPLDIHAGRLTSPPRPRPPGGRMGIAVWGIRGGTPPLLGIRAEELLLL